MNSKYNQKTLGPKGGYLVSKLYDHNCPVFRLADAHKILGGHKNTTGQIVFNLVRHGIITRIKPGLFRLVPFELGSEREYLGNPYVIAKALASSRHHKKYYLSHGSAFDLHQMRTQPELDVYVTTPVLIRPRTVLGTKFHFVRSKPANFFGIMEVWADKNEKVRVSNVEHTILDGLKQPNYCGGISEVAKGFWIKKESINLTKLVDYALRLDNGAVIRRLGFLMEIYKIGTLREMERLKSQLTSTYQLFDPDLPPEGKFISRWKLRLNITENELQHLVRT